MTNNSVIQVIRAPPSFYSSGVITFKDTAPLEFQDSSRVSVYKSKVNLLFLAPEAAFEPMQESKIIKIH